jgi:hypothetical protein
VGTQLSVDPTVELFYKGFGGQRWPVAKAEVSAGVGGDPTLILPLDDLQRRFLANSFITH